MSVCFNYVLLYGVDLCSAFFSYVLMQDQGPHIYQTCPSANFFDCKAMAMGARSQSARTYLEKHLGEFPECDKDELIRHGLRALSDTLPNEVELTVKVSCLLKLILKHWRFNVLILPLTSTNIFFQILNESTWMAFVVIFRMCLLGWWERRRPSPSSMSRRLLSI